MENEEKIKTEPDEVEMIALSSAVTGFVCFHITSRGHSVIVALSSLHLHFCTYNPVSEF